MSPHKVITSASLHAALVAAGVLREDDRVRRIVIDAQLGEAVRIYLERWGDEQLLNVALTVDGTPVEVREVAG